MFSFFCSSFLFLLQGCKFFLLFLFSKCFLLLLLFLQGFLFSLFLLTTFSCLFQSLEFLFVWCYFSCFTNSLFRRHLRWCFVSIQFLCVQFSHFMKFRDIQFSFYKNLKFEKFFSTQMTTQQQQEDNWKVKLWKLVDAHQTELAQLRDSLARDLIATEDKLTKDFSEGVKKAVGDFNATMETIVAESANVEEQNKNV
ncbi:MAG: hypothetical protein B7Z80_00940 [Rhodospirillales bacterium 20-64-7]|nr:MAG: hypothetical protein B7Z80_00940 [Rhodospirillales bacterium 20-64-7]